MITRLQLQRSKIHENGFCGWKIRGFLPKYGNLTPQRVSLGPVSTITRFYANNYNRNGCQIIVVLWEYFTSGVFCPKCYLMATADVNLKSLVKYFGIAELQRSQKIPVKPPKLHQIYAQKNLESNVTISFWVGTKAFKFEGDHPFASINRLLTLSSNLLQSQSRPISSVFCITNIKYILYRCM